MFKTRVKFERNVILEHVPLLSNIHEFASTISTVQMVDFCKLLARLEDGPRIPTVNTDSIKFPSARPLKAEMT